jgi:hypothetical protein
MLIPITSPDAEMQEWALVELQGRIEPMYEEDLQHSLQIGTMQLSKTVCDELSSLICITLASFIHKVLSTTWSALTSVAALPKCWCTVIEVGVHENC